MKIVVHYPESSAAQKNLGLKAAEIHAQSVIYRIKEMRLSEEDTKKLINVICERISIM